MKTVEELEKEINNVEETLNNLKTKVEELKKSKNGFEPTPKVKIPLATKYFLESLNDKYEWIAKDEDGAVWCYKFKPEKYTQDKNKRWTVYGRGNIAGFRDAFKKEIFDFLSWEDEEPTLIQNILDNCEVIDDE